MSYFHNLNKYMNLNPSIIHKVIGFMMKTGIQERREIQESGIPIVICSQLKFTFLREDVFFYITYKLFLEKSSLGDITNRILAICPLRTPICYRSTVHTHYSCHTNFGDNFFISCYFELTFFMLSELCEIHSRCHLLVSSCNPPVS